MFFEWDERKREQTIRECGVDMVYAAQIFEGPVLARVDDRQDYGEERFIAVGMVDDECLVVVYSLRGDRIRLITAWKGGRDGRSRYQAGLARRDQEDEGEG